MTNYLCILTMLLAVLKGFGLIAISWWIVFTPILLLIGAGLFAVFLFIIAFLLDVWKD